jgi:hypothetical protein
MSQPQLSTVELLTTLKHAFSTNTQYSTVTLSPKRANSQLASVSIMNDTEPTAAGEDPTALKPKQTPPVLSTQPSQDINQSPIVNQQQRPTPSSLQMKKIAVVLSRAVRAAMNGNQGYTPYNVGIKAQMPTPGAAQIPMPIGYQQPQAQPAPQQPQAPQQPAVPAAGPSANPINSYGPISMSGDINGNAAFGQKNSPDSMKAAELTWMIPGSTNFHGALETALNLKKWGIGTEKKSVALDIYEKRAMPRRLQHTPSGTGPDQINDALFRFEQLKALVRPDDNTLRQYGLSRPAFQQSLAKIRDKSKGKERFNLSEMAPNPKTHAAIAGGLGLLGTGVLGYYGGMDGAGIGAAATGAGATTAYLNAVNQRKNMLGTAKLMKQYGLLNPQTLQQAYPLIGAD